jgi:hypothetical protein
MCVVAADASVHSRSAHVSCFHIVHRCVPVLTRPPPPPPTFADVTASHAVGMCARTGVPTPTHIAGTVCGHLRCRKPSNSEANYRQVARVRHL